MLIGGVTVAGVQGLPVYVDSLVMKAPRVVMGGGNRSSKIVLAPAELLKLPGVEIVEGLGRLPEPADAAGLSPADTDETS